MPVIPQRNHLFAIQRHTRSRCWRVVGNSEVWKDGGWQEGRNFRVAGFTYLSPNEATPFLRGSDANFLRASFATLPPVRNC